jgi:hypothetical protein
LFDLFFEASCADDPSRLRSRHRGCDLIVNPSMLANAVKTGVARSTVALSGSIMHFMDISTSDYNSI